MKPNEWTLVVCEIAATVGVPALFIYGGIVAAGDRYAVTAGIVLALLTVVTTAIFSIREHFDRRLSSIETGISSITRVDPLPFRDFYPKFKSDIENASLRVDITYLKNEPPSTLGVSTAESYFAELPRLVTQKPGVQFRRIIRNVPGNRDWVLEMTRDYAGLRNFSLGLLPDDHPDQDSIATIAVQLVDNDKTYLLSIGQQNPGNKPDLEVWSIGFNSVWQQYYDRLWDQCLKVILNGLVKQDELERCYPGSGNRSR
jgi:hypothetical protein